MANPVNKTPYVLLNEYIDKAEKILENPADIKTAELFKVFSDLKLSETRKWIDQNDRFKILSGIADVNATKIERILNDRGIINVYDLPSRIFVDTSSVLLKRTINKAKEFLNKNNSPNLNKDLLSIKEELKKGQDRHYIEYIQGHESDVFNVKPLLKEADDTIYEIDSFLSPKKPSEGIELSEF